MTSPTRIKRRLYKDADLAEFARNVCDAFDGLPALEIKEFDAPYTEPLYLGADSEPKILFCGRIRALTALETPLLTGGLTHFVWEGSKSRLRVNSIDGMTPTPGTLYRFTFLLVG